MLLRLILSIAPFLCVFTARGEDWPQFRGPGGRAVSSTATPPIGFGPSSNLLWKVAIPEGVSSPIVRSLPYGNSPLDYKGRLFTVKTGGFVTAYDAKTGQPIYQDERINAPDDYWSSPVAAAGRVYFASEKGVVTVMDATADNPTILAQNKLNEQILATPSLIDQTILVRTAKTLYSFGASK